MIFGVLLIIAPLVGAFVLTWWLGAYALIFGVVLLVLAFQLHSKEARRTAPNEPDGLAKGGSPSDAFLLSVCYSLRGDAVRAIVARLDRGVPRMDEAAGIPTGSCPRGRIVPKLGQGTWGMGEDPRKRRQERLPRSELGLEIGMTLIDTAEMYGNGGAEEIVGEAIEGRRDEVFIVSKVLPDNANKVGMIASCEWSLARLGIEKLDLYLLHWRGRHQLEATLEGFHALMREGLIRNPGASAISTPPTWRNSSALTGGDQVQTDQVLYNLHRRGIEHELAALVPRAKNSDHGLFAVRAGPDLARPCAQFRGRGASRFAGFVALAWMLLQDDVITIPKSSNEAHMRENEAALDLVLSQQTSSCSNAPSRGPSEPRPLECYSAGCLLNCHQALSRNFADQS